MLSFEPVCEGSSPADMETLSLDDPVLSAASFLRFARGDRRASLFPLIPISDGVRLRNRFLFNFGVDSSALINERNRHEPSRLFGSKER